MTAEERKRLFELAAMIFTTALLVGISRLEKTLFELGEKLAEHRDFLTSVVYFGLINFNVVLILILSFLIFRNVAKLVLDRRRGVIGSRLRTKLVVTLVFFAVAPTALLFYVSTRFLTESFDTWFSSRVEATIYQTREAGEQIYKRDVRRIESLARIALQRIDVTNEGPIAELYSIPVLNANRLEGFDKEYRLDSLKVYDVTGRLLWKSGGLTTEDLVKYSRPSYVLESVDMFAKDPSLFTHSTVAVEDGRDVVRGLSPIYSDKSQDLLGIVVAEEKFETQIMSSVEDILRRFAELKPNAQVNRISYLVLLIMMVLIIVFSATWLGFYVSRGITGPIQTLGEATREVALGNYDIRLEVKTDDETGQLVQSFNRMTRDLKVHEEQAKRFLSELERTNHELDQRRRYIEVILRNISAGVISVDPDGKIATFNRSAERLLGIAAGEALGQPVQSALGTYLTEAFYKPLAERIETRTHYSCEIDLQRGDTQLTLIADTVKMFDEDGSNLGIVILFDDASEQVKLQRVAAWREVARRIAHEIKNPITPIKLSAQRLLRRFGGDFTGENGEVFRGCIETIIAEVDSLRDLVNEFSKFSRLPAIRTKDEDINEIIIDVANLYSLSYPSIDFNTSGLNKQVPRAPLDREQMGRVLNNIVTNAVAAIPQDGRQGQIEFTTQWLQDLNMIRIEIVDNGAGIPNALKGKVLEPYFSTKSEGTGLGLAIVSQIITDHGGYLRLLDNDPFGTKVVIELPLLGKSKPRVAHQ